VHCCELLVLWNDFGQRAGKFHSHISTSHHGHPINFSNEWHHPALQNEKAAKAAVRVLHTYGGKE
jgi:hypothetical protein